MQTAVFGSLEIRLFDLAEQGYFCRLGQPGDQPSKVTDGFYPSRDLGLLWFRWVDGHLACSGMLCGELFGDRQVSALLDFIDENLLKTDHSIDYQIDLVQKKTTLVSCGEYDYRF